MESFLSSTYMQEPKTVQVLCLLFTAGTLIQNDVAQSCRHIQKEQASKRLRGVKLCETLGDYISEENAGQETREGSCDYFTSSLTLTTSWETVILLCIAFFFPARPCRFHFPQTLIKISSFSTTLQASD